MKSTAIQDALAAMTVLRNAIEGDRYDEDNELFYELPEAEQDAWEELMDCIEEINNYIDSEVCSFSA
jgi:hypothetical protein